MSLYFQIPMVKGLIGFLMLMAFLTSFSWWADPKKGLFIAWIRSVVVLSLFALWMGGMYFLMEAFSDVSEQSSSLQRH